MKKIEKILKEIEEIEKGARARKLELTPVIMQDIIKDAKSICRKLKRLGVEKFSLRYALRYGELKAGWSYKGTSLEIVFSKNGAIKSWSVVRKNCGSSWDRFELYDVPKEQLRSVKDKLSTTFHITGLRRMYLY